MRDFSRVKRVVVKIGTNTLSRGGKVDTAYVGRIARQVCKLLEEGREVLIVTSGAIGMGAGRLGLKGKVKGTKMRQACAATGQPLLMDEYRKAFGKSGVNVAQVLVTAEVLNNRRSYLNLRNAVEGLLKLKVVPVINENDSVSTEEIGTAFGDNDTLSALVASKIDADLLIMLSDIDALYDRDPRKHSNAVRVPAVYEITKEITRSAGAKTGHEHAVGGMKTKITAARIASDAGCRMVLANGRARNVIGRIMAGADIGTVFMPKRKLSNRKRWILNNKAVGTINIDDGAMRAVCNNKSLLPSGIVSVSGAFDAGAVVMLNDGAKAVSNFSSGEIRQVIGKHSSEIRKLLGAKRRDVVAVPEDIVLIEY
jgi:glutamate 5-kinase